MSSLRFLGSLAGVLWLLVGSSSASAQCFQDVLLTVSPDDNNLRTVSLDDYSTLSEVELTLPNDTITGCTGIAVRPSDGMIFFLAKFDQPPPFDQITNLCTVDLSQDPPFVLPIGGTLTEFQSLTFDDTGVLLSVSSETAVPQNAFCELSQSLGSPTDLCGVPNGDDGDAVSFDSDTGVVFHASGNDDVIFEEVGTTSAGNPCDVMPVSIVGTPLVNAPLATIAYSEIESAFLWGVLDADNSVYSVTTAGDATLIGALDHTPSGFAIQSTVITCPTDLFIRGDVDRSGSFQGLVDGLYILNFQFIPGSPAPPCMKAADADGNGSVNGLVDGLYILNFQFVPGSPPPPSPFPACGADTSPVSCDSPLTPPC